MLPDEIGKCTALEVVNVTANKITTLAPLAPLTGLCGNFVIIFGTFLAHSRLQPAVCRGLRIAHADWERLVRQPAPCCPYVGRGLITVHADWELIGAGNPTL